MPNQDWQSLIGLVIVLCGLAAGGTWLFLKLSRWIGKSSREPKPGARRPAWVWVFLISVVALITYILTPSRQPGQPEEQVHSSLWLVLLVVGLPLVFLAMVVGIHFYRNYDRDASLAMKRANAGDLDGALAYLEAAMGRRPSLNLEPVSPNPYAAPAPRLRASSVRTNVLGLLHFLREEWPEAHQAFLEAEALGADRATVLSNQGAVLLKLNRPAEAEAVMAEACRLNQGHPIFAANLGFALIDLDRFDEAHAQLARAEKNSRWYIPFTAAARKQLDDELARLRAKLAADPDVSAS